MKTELVDVSPTRKELKVEIEASDVRAAYDAVSERYAQLANVPGFRKGRVPVAVVRQRFKNEIRSEVLQQLVPQAINDAINEAGLRVIGEPDVHLDNNEALDKFGEQPISLHAHMDVIPEVALGEYRGLAGARRLRPVTDEMVEQLIEGLRESSASLQPVEERGAELGDTVTANFTGHFIARDETGERVESTEEPINVEDVEVVIGGDGVVAEFNEQLLGTRPDDVKTFTVSYPEDFSSKGLAGKEIEYTATVTAVRRKELPEMDDEWAQSLGEDLDTVEKLRERVRENLSDRAKFESDHRLRDELFGKMVAAHQFELPEALVEHETRRLLESTIRDMMQRGLDPRNQELNWEALQESLRTQANENLRGSLLLERIAEAEGIEVTDEEIEQEIVQLAQSSRQTVEQVRDALTKQGGERSIADRVRHRKALDLIVENASVQDEEWREEEEAVRADGAPTQATSQAGGAETETGAGGATDDDEQKQASAAEQS